MEGAMLTYIEMYILVYLAPALRSKQPCLWLYALALQPFPMPKARDLYLLALLLHAIQIEDMLCK